jgi:hypothetical protein
VFCTEKTLMNMLRTIELAQHGFYVPFVLKTRSYGYSVTPDHTGKGRTSEAIQGSDRAKFEALVAADKAKANDPDPY